MIEFGAKKEFIGWCQICGLPLEQDGACKKYHIKKLPKKGRFSGASKRMKGKYEDY